MMELDGALLGVVEIPGSDRGVVHLGLGADAGYFNSGVLLIDLRQWRETRALETLLEYVEANPDKMVRDVDQEALNACFHNRKKPLDYKWNAIRTFYEEAATAPLTTYECERVQKEARVIHFNGSSKPWSYFCTHPKKAEYEKYLLLTEWRNFVPEDRTFLNRIRKAVSMILPKRVKAILKRVASLVLRSRR
jgi:lipopolysaccharide biosynthesis glycosyltransferase